MNILSIEPNEKGIYTAIFNGEKIPFIANITIAQKPKDFTRVTIEIIVANGPSGQVVVKENEGLKVQ